MAHESHNASVVDMTLKKALCIAAAACGIIGCQTLASDYDQPATIIDPTDASRAALQETINSILNTEVTIADDALTDSSVLIIEHTPPRTMQNPTPDGRILDMPFQFQLVINGSDCILVDQRDRSRHTLKDTSCAAE